MGALHETLQATRNKKSTKPTISPQGFTSRQEDQHGKAHFDRCHITVKISLIQNYLQLEILYQGHVDTI